MSTKLIRKTISNKIKSLISELEDIDENLDVWNPSDQDECAELADNLSVVNDSIVDIIASIDQNDFDNPVEEDEVEDNESDDEDEEDDDVAELDAELTFDEVDEDDD